MTCLECKSTISEHPVSVPCGHVHIKCYKAHAKGTDDPAIRFHALLNHAEDPVLLRTVIESCISDTIKKQILNRYNIEILERRVGIKQIMAEKVYDTRGEK